MLLQVHTRLCQGRKKVIGEKGGEKRGEEEEEEEGKGLEREGDEGGERGSCRKGEKGGALERRRKKNDTLQRNISVSCHLFHFFSSLFRESIASAAIYWVAGDESPFVSFALEETAVHVQPNGALLNTLRTVLRYRLHRATYLSVPHDEDAVA